MIAVVVGGVLVAVKVFFITQAVTVVKGGIIYSLFHIRKGYKPGETAYTNRAHDGGVVINMNSPSPIGASLGGFAEAIPSFAKYKDYNYDFTESEGEYMKALIIPASRALVFFGQLQDELRMNQEELTEATEGLKSQMDPIRLYLDNFPKARKKKCAMSS